MTPSYRQIAAFFLPLALTSLIMSLSHTVVNAGVARTPEPEIALAAYALARSIVRIIENPMFMVRQTVVSLTRDYHSFLRIKRFMYIMAWAISAVLALLAFTPLGYYGFRNIIGASPEVARQSHLALMVLFVMPLTTVWRNIYHGVAIVCRQTILVPKTSILRLIIMSAIIFTLAYTTELPGALSASIAFIGAFGIEACVMRWRARPLLEDTRYIPLDNQGKILTSRHIFLFFFPLIITTAMTTAFGPMINIGLARSLRPEIALAAYSVGHALSRIFIAPLNMLHQATLAFVKLDAPGTFRVTGKFVMFLALLASGLLGTIGFSPVGTWLLETVVGVSDEVTHSARLVLQVMALMPLALGWREYLWGILMQQQKTGLIGRGKGLNLVVLILVLVTLLLDGRMNPAAAGALSMVIGETANCIYMQLNLGRAIGIEKKQSA